MSLSVEQKLSEAMRTAMADVRPPDGLAAAGLARGRRARRRARMLQAGGAVLALSAVTATGVSVLGNGPEPAVTLTAPGSMSPVPEGAADRLQRVDLAEILRGLLPRGGRLLAPSGGSPLPRNGQMGPVFLQGQYDDGKGPVGISLSISRQTPGESDSGCPPVHVRPYDRCRAEKRPDGSVLMINKGFTWPNKPDGEKAWTAALTRPDGSRVEFEQVNAPESKSTKGPTRPEPPLSTAQMSAIVTSPDWKKIIDLLPEPARVPRNEPRYPGEELMTKLRRLLPGDGKITHPDIMDGHVGLLINDAKGRTMLSLNVQTLLDPQGRPLRLSECAERIKADPVQATCTKETLPDGGVLYLQQHAAEVAESGVTVRIADVIYPDGFRVVVRVANGLSAKSGPKTRSTPAFTLDQLRAIVTDPSWRG